MTCPCKQGLGAMRARGDSALRGPKMERKHCVLDKHGRTVRCFRKVATAKRVARQMGSGYKVG